MDMIPAPAIALLGIGGTVFVALVVRVFAKLKDGGTPETCKRAKIHNCITENPGSTFSDIKMAVGIGNGTLSYHLFVLERLELIRSIKDGRERRFFPVGIPAEIRLDQCLGRTESKVLQKLVEGGPKTNSRLAESLGISRQRAHYNLKLLRDRGLANLENGAWSHTLSVDDSRDNQNGFRHARLTIDTITRDERSGRPEKNLTP